jgi:hypothetical protein
MAAHGFKETCGHTTRVCFCKERNKLKNLLSFWWKHQHFGQKCGVPSSSYSILLCEKHCIKSGVLTPLLQEVGLRRTSRHNVIDEGRANQQNFIGQLS